jgi:CheY-like chemotaxis protein
MTPAIRGTILLVDDDPAILLTLGDQLQFEGYRVIKAESAEQALKRIEAGRPDLIILDISMPGIGGMAFLKQIDQVAGTLKFPVLVFTARAELSKFFRDTGVDGFLPKTTDIETLLREIDRIISKQRAPHPEPETTPSGSHRRMRVLVVENDAYLCERLVSILSRNGYEVAGAGISYAAIETAVRQTPDLILLNYIMPHLNGPSLAVMLGTMPTTQKIPVVIYDETGLHDPQVKLPNVRTVVHKRDEETLLHAVNAILRS